jgi:hypothetical protein
MENRFEIHLFVIWPFCALALALNPRMGGGRGQHLQTAVQRAVGGRRTVRSLVGIHSPDLGGVEWLRGVVGAVLADRGYQGASRLDHLKKIVDKSKHLVHLY